MLASVLSDAPRTDYPVVELDSKTGFLPNLVASR